MLPDSILIAELYGPVLHGEGALLGRRSHVIRTAGCSYRCRWCDSMHAVDPWEIKTKSRRMTATEIVDAIRAKPAAPWITVGGGDPAGWDMGEVCFALRMDGYRIAVETQGALWHDWLDTVDLVTCSPKPPSSGMADRLDVAMLRKYEARLRRRLHLKIVAFDEADLDFAERIHKAFTGVPFYITVGTPPAVMQERTVNAARAIDRLLDSYRSVSEMVLARPALADAVVAAQQHVFLYGRRLAV